MYIGLECFHVHVFILHCITSSHVHIFILHWNKALTCTYPPYIGTDYCLSALHSHRLMFFTHAMSIIKFILVGIHVRAFILHWNRRRSRARIHPTLKQKDLFIKFILILSSRARTTLHCNTMTSLRVHSLILLAHDLSTDIVYCQALSRLICGSWRLLPLLRLSLR